jgi:hypothetical protein
MTWPVLLRIFAADDDLGLAVAVHVGDRRVVGAVAVDAVAEVDAAPLLAAVAGVERTRGGVVDRDDLGPAVAVEVAEREAAAVAAVVALGLPRDAAAVAPQRDHVVAAVEEHEREVAVVEVAAGVGVDRLAGDGRAAELAVAPLPLDDRLEAAHLQRDVARGVERDEVDADVRRRTGGRDVVVVAVVGAAGGGVAARLAAGVLGVRRERGGEWRGVVARRVTGGLRRAVRSRTADRELVARELVAARVAGGQTEGDARKHAARE